MQTSTNVISSLTQTDEETYSGVANSSTQICMDCDGVNSAVIYKEMKFLQTIRVVPHATLFHFKPSTIDIL